MFKKTILASLFIYIALISFSPLLVQAQGLVPQDNSAANKSCPPGYDGDNCGDYNLDSFIVLAVNASRWILGIVGSLTLLMFIYGGFMFLISAGSSTKVEEARKIIVAAVVGLLIVLASYLIIKFVLSSMGLNWNGGQSVTKLTSSQTQVQTNSSSPVLGQALCASMHPGYNCMNNAGVPSSACYRDLCDGGNNNLCCDPTAACSAVHPGYSCMDSTGQTDCFSGACGGNNSIQCCSSF